MRLQKLTTRKNEQNITQYRNRIIFRYKQIQLLKNQKAFQLFNSKTNGNNLRKKNTNSALINKIKENINYKCIDNPIIYENYDLKVIKIPKPSGTSKSQTKRFQINDVEIPGSGKHNIGNFLYKKNLKDYPRTQKKQISLINKLMLKNRYSNIPSIPGKQQQYGYTVNENNELKLNKSKESVGYYYQQNVFENKRKRGVSWNNQNRTMSLKQNDQNSSLGPGSYDILNIGDNKPLYKLKQSASFISKSIKVQRKGEKKQQFIKQQDQKTIEFFQKYDLNVTNFSDSEYEYIEDATPGPGSYLNQTQISSMKTTVKQEKFQYFGSKQQRFKSQKLYTQLGPGDFNPNDFIKFNAQKKTFNQKKTPFNSKSIRFDNKQDQDIKPAPGQYDYKNTGTKATLGLHNKDLNIYMMKTKQYIPAPGSYNVDIYDISSKFKKDEEYDTELAIKRPGFLTGEARFKEIQRNQSKLLFSFFLDNIIKKIQIFNRKKLILIVNI
ncbi:hypothetical protein IMG5_185540 [Ichthyophthirius multifiliis]|uniref:Uncharacterized protein n=1 Tax=Ichthyophthirius multifiliis TaxID=5932 RepID=G0R3I2_ICHMU|nr:hypothetical protein IMG5_185540 [Ichthyophthirius multifiliis]EGR27971.1 hypothetical protein IMG5_185540 [Ichthyophthirius multifiliis]|eukprot:XP_004027316.1 hypothetical protein IMG5_185540 [Ichthyophthirius multifiliis]